MIRPLRASIVALVAAAGIVPATAASSSSTPHQRAGVILWNRLDNANAVRHSDVGPNGTVFGGSFVPGRFGGAYMATHDQDYLVRFPFWALNHNRGTIEFWARISGFPSYIDGGGGNQPAFVELRTADGGDPKFRFIL